MMISENGALVQFFRHATQNNHKSAQAGRPVYDDFDHVRIQTPGDTRTTVSRKANDQDKARFPKAWEAYQKGLETPEEGTPLEQWPQATASQVNELRYVSVRTVEHVAALSDASVQRLGPGYQQLRQHARQYLDAAQNNANATAIARENEELRDQLRLMKEQIDALTAAQALAAKESADQDSDSGGDDDANDGDQDGQAPRRGPGRPRKTEAVE